MRKQVKPISGQVGNAKNPRRPNNLQLAFQDATQLNSTFVVEQGLLPDWDGFPTSVNKETVAQRAPSSPSPVSKEPNLAPRTPTTPTGSRPSTSSASSKLGRSPAVSKRAKTKWEILERKVALVFVLFLVACRLFLYASFLLAYCSIYSFRQFIYLFFRRSERAHV